VSTLVLVACGTFGGLLFTAIYLLEGATRPGYDPMAQPISTLSLGPGGWLQQANFVLFGTLLVLSAVGWRRLLRGTPAAIAYPSTRAIAGIGLIVDGLASQDAAHGYPPGTTTTASFHGAAHNAAAFVVILALAAGCFILARRFSIDPVWKTWAPIAAAAGLLTLGFITAFGASGGTGGAAGVFERLAGGANSVLGAAVLLRLLALDRRSRRRKLRRDPIAVLR
jgi:hypothetical protein